MTSFSPHFIQVGAPLESAERLHVVLHGIMGSGGNWRGFFSALLRANPELAKDSFLLPDLRYHGKSASLSPPPPDTVANAAKDILDLLQKLGQCPHAIIGHSFGGAVALGMGQELKAAQIVVLDTGLDKMSPELPPSKVSSEALEVIHALGEIPFPLASRQDLIPILTGLGFSEMLARWMTTNLKREKGLYELSLDLEGIKRLMDSYYQLDVWAWVENIKTQLTVIRGGRSDHITKESVVKLEAKQVPFYSIDDAGHWLHMDQPEKLSAILRELLLS